MRRRLFLLGLIASTTTASMLRAGKAAGGSKQERFEIVRSESEWRAVLSEQEFLVLRQEETERPFTSALLDEKREGLYTCAACDLALFSSKAKYDSGTGWPSFFEPLSGAVRTREDRKLVFARTEVHCRRCGGHLGHVFDDGPEPTGKRYCINGIALDFVPSQNG